MHILIVNPFGIGDCLFTTTLIHTLKEEFPHHRLGFLCNKRTAGMFKNNPFLDKIFVYERDDFKRLLSISRQQWLRAFNSFIREIKKERFDLAIDLSLAANFGFFLWLAGIKKRVGYNYKNRGYFLTAEIKLPGYEDKHIVEYYNGLLELLEIKPKYNHLELYLNEEDKRYVEDVFTYQNIGHQNPVIVIAPGGGASWGVDAKLKRWPEENFILLVDKLVEKYKATVIIVGDLNEKDLLINLKTDKNIINLTGQTSLGQLAAVINKSDLFIGNDGGPLHIAVALGKKTVSFFGPVDPKVYGPYPAEESRHIVFKKTLKCSPCYRKFRLNPCQRNRECLERINVDEVIDGVGRLLTNTQI